MEDDPKAPFPIATTPSCRGRYYSFTLDSYLIMLRVKQGDIKFHFVRFWYDSTWFHRPLANTLLTRSIVRYIYIYIYIYIYHHVVPLARISLTLSCHFSLSFIVSGRSSGLHPVSSHSCCMYVRAGCPAFAWPYAGVHRSTSLLQQYPACLVRLTWIVFVMGGRWPYSWCLVGCCRQDLFNIARYILV